MLDAQVPEELEQLVARALKKDPAGRLQTAEEFASGLYLAAQQLRRVAAAAATESPRRRSTPTELDGQSASARLDAEPVMPQTALVIGVELPAPDATIAVTAQVPTPE